MKSHLQTFRGNYGGSKFSHMNRKQIPDVDKLQLCHLVAVDIPPQRRSVQSPNRWIPYPKCTTTTANSVVESDDGKGDYDRQQHSIYNASKALDDLTINMLEPISIAPTFQKKSRMLSLHQTFTFQKPEAPPSMKTSVAIECCTQTSSILLNDSLSKRPPSSSETTISACRVPIGDKRYYSVNSLRMAGNQFEEKTRPYAMAASTSERAKPLQISARLQELINNRKTNWHSKCQPSSLSVRKIIESPSNIDPTANEPYYGGDLVAESSVQQISSQPIRKRHLGPGSSEIVLVHKYNLPNNSSTSLPNGDDVTSVFSDNLSLASIIEKLFNFSWEVTLEGMHELLYIAPRIEWSEHLRESVVVQRKLLECFRSPRSTIRRVACQVSGEMFRITKCTRRPEFDELTDELLAKTADTNRFIQRDANMALDKMVASLPPFHVVRAICTRAPLHKNPVIRATSARLLIGICSIHSVDAIIGLKANVHTRKRVLGGLSKFLVDRNQDTRKYGERLCKLLRKHRFFHEYFFKDMETNVKSTLKKIVNNISPKLS